MYGTSQQPLYSPNPHTSSMYQSQREPSRRVEEQQVRHQHLQSHQRSYSTG